MIRPVQQLPATAAPADLAALYRDPPDGVRVNTITSLDGAAFFDGVAGPLSNPTDQNLLLTLRGYADVILVGAGTVRAERYGPVRLDAPQIAERQQRWGISSVPPIAVVTHTGQADGRSATRVRGGDEGAAPHQRTPRPGSDTVMRTVSRQSHPARG